MVERRTKGFRRFAAVAAALLLSVTASARASAPDGGRFSVGLETGTFWFSRNDVRIPGDTGTEFDMGRLTGSGAEIFGRFDVHWRIDDRHSVRLVYAPLEVSGTGRFERDTDFAGGTFAAGEETKGTYRFDAYKLSYRYTFPARGGWRWGIGFTGVVRDAEIELRQGEASASDDDVGFVPALHIAADYRLSERLVWRFDFDGLAGGPGRLIDLAVKLSYDVDERWRVGGGYRTLEGGADTDEVFNFAWLNYAVLDVRYRF